MTAQEFLHLMKTDSKKLYPDKLCPSCDRKFEPCEPPQFLDNVRVCNDCYFEALGEVVEKYPPVPGPSRILVTGESGERFLKLLDDSK